MSHISDRFVVVLDANVLFPFRVRDALLRFAEAGLYRARWSQQILAEWQKNLLAQKPHLEASVRSQIEAMHEIFPEAMISGHEGLLPASVQLPDEGDRHVIEAAIRGDAQHIVTENIKHFPGEVLSRYDLVAVTADQFLWSTYELYPKPATDILEEMRESYDRPSMCRSEFIMDLRRYGLGKTASLYKDNT